MLHPQAVLEPMKRSAETSEHGRRNSTRVGTDGLSFVRLQRSAVLIPFTLGPLEEDKLSGNLIWLRRRLVKGGWWIVSTLLGWYLVLFLVTMDALYHSKGAGRWPLVDSVGPLAIPLLFSLPQSVFIRRQFRKAAWLWIVARPLAWIAGIGLFALASRSNIVRLDLFGQCAVFGKDVLILSRTALSWLSSVSVTQPLREPRSYGYR